MAVCLASAAAVAVAQAPIADGEATAPRTTPERTAHAETSRSAEVEAFLAQ